MKLEYDINPELLIEFIDESEESLTALDSLFVELEGSENSIEIVNAIFRPIHSLKGNAAYFGLMRVKELAHKMENLLDALRQGKLVVNTALIDVLLPGLDLLKTMLAHVREGGDELQDKNRFDSVLGTIVQFNASVVKSDDASLSAARLNALVAGLREVIPQTHVMQLDQVVMFINTLCPGVLNAPSLPDKEKASAVMPDELSALIEVLKAVAVQSSSADTPAHVEGLLSALRSRSANTQTREIIDQSLDMLEIFTRSDAGFDSLLADMLLEKCTELSAAGVWHDSVNSKEAPAASTQANAAPAPHDTGSDKTMRISEKSLDRFLTYVGELVVVEEMFGYLSKSAAADAQGIALHSFRPVLDTFRQLSEDLRRSVMDIRMVPGKVLMQKAYRIPRDIAAESGKKIKVICIGDDVKIDKSYIDMLDAPLTHMVRNAADHGIEPVTQRLSINKPEEGTITVELYEQESIIQFAVADDGKGIDYDALKKKAVQLGLIGANQHLSENDIIGLLFASGVSTASTVTDVSGRGVGMDVVKRSIEFAGGTIRVESTPQKGARFSITLPKNVSTQIMEGYLVRAANQEVYALPMKYISEAFAVAPSALSHAQERGTVVMRRGQLMRVEALDRLLGVGNSGHSLEDAEKLLLVSLLTQGAGVALQVGEILGVQKIVVKPLDEVVNGNSLFDGAAMMGDGKIAMIIGENGLRNVGICLE